MLLAACLFALPTCVPSAVLDDDRPAADRALVVRLHSLTGLVEQVGTLEDALSLLPYRACSSQADPDVNREPGSCVFHCEDLCALVRETVEPTMWDETPGARLDLRGPDCMLVVAPQEVQEKVADFLGHLTIALLPTEVLEVRMVAPDPSDRGRNETVIDVAEADRRIAERGLLRRATVALRDRAVVEGGAIDCESIVYDWDVEIAQGATISDPVVDRVETGVRFIARSTRVEGGLLVNLVARASDRAAPTRERHLQARSLVNAKPVMSDRTACGAFEHPQLAFASFAGSVFLPEGKAVWVPVEVATHLGPVSFCLDLRVSGRFGPFRSTIDLGGKRNGDADGSGEGGPLRFDLMSRGAADLGNVAIERVARSLFGDLWTQNGTGPIWARLPMPDDDGLLAELAHTVASQPLEEGVGSVGTTSGALRICLPKGFADRVVAALAPLQRFDPSVVLRGRLLVGEDERASFRVPVVVGRPLALWAGVQGTRIADWDVEVANEAQACNPQPEAWVDGFGLRIVLSRNAHGDFELDVNGKVSLLDGPPEPIDLQDDSHLTIDRVRAKTLFLDEVRTLPAQGGKATFTGDVSVELEVVPAAR